MTNKAQLNIEYLPVNQLTPYERNARKHQAPDVDAIVASIQEFGFDDPIGVWGEKNLIVEGHGRLLAAKKLGMDTVPVIRLDHLTDEQRRAYALAHNRTAELSEWDEVVKDLELADIKELDMRLFGFGDPQDVNHLTDEGAEENNPTLKLPQSRVMIISVSAFGTNSEIMLEGEIDPEVAGRLLEKLHDTTAVDVLQSLMQVLHDV